MHASLLGVIFTIVYTYSAAIHQDGVYESYEIAAWAALVAYTVAAILAAAEYRLRIVAWTSRLWVRRAHTQKISEARLDLPEQAWGPREGYPPESPDDA